MFQTFSSLLIVCRTSQSASDSYTTFEYSPNGGSDPNHYWMVGDGSSGSNYFRIYGPYGDNNNGDGPLFNRWGGIAIY